jgi:hypothetical protein
MKPKMILFALTLVIAIFLAGCVGPDQEKQEELEEKEGVEGVDYEIKPAEPGWSWLINEHAGYKIKYPNEWKSLGVYVSPGDEFLIEDPEGDGSFFVGCIPLKEARELLRAESSWELVKAMAYSLNKVEIRIVEASNFTLSGAPATELVYTSWLKHPKTGEKIIKRKEMATCIIEGKFLYWLSYDCAEVDTFDKYYPTIQKMVNSFEFI